MIPAFIPELLVVILKCLGIVAVFVAVAFFIAAAVLISAITRNRPEGWK